MHFKNGFVDQNGERYMLEIRIGKLLNDLWSKYLYYAYFDSNLFEKAEGDIPYAELPNAAWEPFDGAKERWGRPDGNAWFRQTFVIPPEMDGKTVIYTVHLTGNSGWCWGCPQVLAYVNGVANAGMGANHTDITLTQCAKAGDTYTMELAGFINANAYSGQVDMKMLVAAANLKTRQLYYDIHVPFDVSLNLPEDDTRRLDIIRHLNHALSLVDFRLPIGDELDKTLDAAIAYMKEEFYGKFCGSFESLTTAAGHTHIDTAWRWQLFSTRKKVARSFSTALRWLEEYPEYIFMSSQPQLYQFLKEDLPDAYEKVKEMVAAGRWQPEGGMWVEPDTNIPSGESLVRQFLYGKKFFREEFGVDSRIMWLPDVFGYSAALPQIMKKCGIDYFMTTKISWNEFDKLPCDTFRWKGIDGSEVLTHFVPTMNARFEHPKEFRTTYNGDLNPDNAIGGWRRYSQKDLNRDVLFSAGHGDGGGGTTRSMIENARRMNQAIPGCPKVVWDTPLNYFEKLEREVGSNPKLPVWDGELYFEYHRGTYTSVAKIKKHNRKTEVLLSDAELFSVMNAGLPGQTHLPQQTNYPREALDKSWHLLLLNQFHDILPGSSIKGVYDDADVQFEEINGMMKPALNKALEGLAAQVNCAQDALVVFNSSPFDRDDAVEFSTDRAEGFTLAGAPVQKTEQGTYIFFAKDIPAKGYKVFPFTAPMTARPIAQADASGVETADFKVALDQNGHIASLFAKAISREMVLGDPMNRLIAMEDVVPVDDAWNIDSYINEKTWGIDGLDSTAVVENGPVRCVLRQTRRFMDSAITQDLIFVQGLPRIDVKTHIDWKNDHILLKADFPFPVNAPRATFDIQFGNVERTTHENTSWDFAQFETCMHEWIDLSEDAFGLSLLNDCK
ncbi:MAG: alpha-mannosidase, partial [Oscillospiraceae bacterium]|nr:alpha-mannosidase [Oscillospiraceae bacterium]